MFFTTGVSMHSKAIGKEVLNQQLKVTELAIDFPVCDNDSIVTVNSNTNFSESL